MLAPLFALVFLHERLGPRGWLGIVFVGVGILLLALKPDPSLSERLQPPAFRSKASVEIARG